MSLLDKASLVQIPSGYKSTKLYSVKPINGNGDFTFARSSSATRVNSEGLIEVASVLGSELVVNGDFATDSDWTKGTGWSISGGVAIANNVPNLQRLQTGVGSSVIGKKYKYSIDISNVSGAYSVYIFGVYVLASVNTEGTLEGYVTATSTNGAFWVAGATAGGLVSATIDNVSVKEVIENDVPRLDYSGGASCASLLLEGQSTNLVTDSNANFTINQCTISYNNTTSPEGITNAYKATATGTSSSFVRTGNISFDNPSAFSVFFKYGDNQWLQIINAGNVTQYVNVDIQNGTFGTNGSGVSDLLAEDFGNGWYRISGKFSGYSGNGTLRVYMGSTSNAGWAGANAIVDNYYYGYGFQVESGSYPTSYIPTSGSTVTRTADVCNNAGTSATFNDSEGVLFFEAKTTFDSSLSRRVTISDGSISNRVSLEFDESIENTIKGFINSTVLIYAADSLSTYNKIALQYKSGEHKLWINGNEVQTSTNANIPSGLDRLSFDGGDGNNDFYGKTKQLMVFDEALSDEELSDLTGQVNLSFNNLATFYNYTIL